MALVGPADAAGRHSEPLLPHFFVTIKLYPKGLGFRVWGSDVPNIWVLRVLVIVVTVQVWGKYMIIRYLHP